jgi:hypothetical protein
VRRSSLASNRTSSSYWALQLNCQGPRPGCDRGPQTPRNELLVSAFRSKRRLKVFRVNTRSGSLRPSHCTATFVVCESQPAHESREPRSSKLLLQGSQFGREPFVVLRCTMNLPVSHVCPQMWVKSRKLNDTYTGESYGVLAGPRCP